MTAPSSAPDKSMCYYRDPDNGNRCFIGALIQDEDYRPEIEGVSVRFRGYKPFGAAATLELAIVRGLNAMGIEIDELSDDIRIDFEQLQSIHDEWGDGRCGRESVKKSLISFAKSRKLSTAALTAEVAA